MRTWGIGTLVVAGLGLGLFMVAMDTEGSSLSTPYGYSGRWENPQISDLCEDTQRCAEWHDDTDGEFGPKTLCCVEASRLPANDFGDCLVAFRGGPRDD